LIAQSVRPMSRAWIAYFQRTQLHRAARDGDAARVRELLQRKYPVNRFNEDGKTALHYAVAGEHLAIVDLLLAAGADVNARDERVIGDTPLGEYAGSCSVEMAKRLVDAGADPTIAGWMRLTALDKAAERKRADGKQVLRLLEEAARERVASRKARRYEL